MILQKLRKLLLPVRGSSTVERILVKDMAEGSSPSPGAISRRKFFSFFGTGVVFLAKPDLFTQKKEVVKVHLAWDETKKNWGWWTVDERIFFMHLVTPQANLLPAVPDAPDGQALYSTTPWNVDLKEDQELKRLVGW